MVEPTLEERIEAHQNRLRESLARPRAETVQRVAYWLGSLRFADSFHTIEDIERRVLSLIDDIRKGIEEVQGVQIGYATALAEREQEATRLKAELESLDPLDASRQRRFEQYHLAVADAMVYRESREAIEVSVTELQRGFQQRLRNLEPTIERYYAAKIAGMVREAEEALEAARGKIAHAEQLKLRAAAFPGEFRRRYGLQEGEHGDTAN